MAESFLTIEEAADRLRIRRSKAYDLIAKRELGSVKIGRARRIPESLLANYQRRLIEEQVASSQPRPCPST